MFLIPTTTMLKIATVTAVLAVTSWFVYDWHTSAIAEAVTSTKNTILVEQQKQTIKLLDRQQGVNIALQQTINERNKQHAKDVADLNDKYYAAITGLRNRPSRTLGTDKSISYTSTRDGKATTGCYPSQLYREDAGMAIDFSKDAEQVRLALLKCYDDYDIVKKKIDDFVKNK